MVMTSIIPALCLRKLRTCTMAAMMLAGNINDARIMGIYRREIRLNGLFQPVNSMSKNSGLGGETYFNL